MAQSEVSTLNLAAYCSGDFGPGISDELIANVQQKGKLVESAMLLRWQWQPKQSAALD